MPKPSNLVNSSHQTCPCVHTTAHREVGDRPYLGSLELVGVTLEVPPAELRLLLDIAQTGDTPAERWVSDAVLELLGDTVAGWGPAVSSDNFVLPSAGPWPRHACLDMYMCFENRVAQTGHAWTWTCVRFEARSGPVYCLGFPHALCVCIL